MLINTKEDVLAAVKRGGRALYYLALKAYLYSDSVKAMEISGGSDGFDNWILTSAGMMEWI